MIFAAISLVLSLFVVLAGPAGAQQQGDVKIHDGDGEPDPIDQNEPKVGCTFHLHGFNFNDDEPIVWWIEAWPGGDATYGTGDDVLSNEIVAGENGEWRDPQSGTYSLPALGPGNDYRLFWDRESLDAPDDPEGPQTKHKNFDVECPPPTTTTTTTTVGIVEDTTTTTVPDDVLGTVITTSTTAPLAPVTTDEVLDTAVEAEELPFTGLESDQLIGLAVLLLAGGLVVLGSTGRREEN